ncbi:MAG: RebB family R body protein [Myxococcales bacterium]|nr:RebB family R body protein [Myxococcales bacterium]
MSDNPTTGLDVATVESGEVSISDRHQFHLNRRSRAFANQGEWCQATEEQRTYAETSAEVAAAAIASPNYYLDRVTAISHNMEGLSEDAEERFRRPLPERVRPTPSRGADGVVGPEGVRKPGVTPVSSSEDPDSAPAQVGSGRLTQRVSTSERSASARQRDLGEAPASDPAAPWSAGVRERVEATRARRLASSLPQPLLVRGHDEVTSSLAQLNTLVIGSSPSFATAMRLSTEALASGLAALNAVSHQKCQQTLAISATAKSLRESGLENDQ